MFVKKSKLSSSCKGSVLIFSLIVLAFMLVSALSVATVSVTERRSSLATDKSSRSFQAADSGVEIMLQKIYKGGFETSPLSALGSCNNGEISDTLNSGTYTITFYDNADDPLTSCDDAAWRSKVVKIKSAGVSGNTTRAVTVGVKPSTYATFDPTKKGTNITLSSDKLTASATNYDMMVESTIGKSSGKWYWEFTWSGGDAMLGVAKSGLNYDAASWQQSNAADAYSYYAYNGTMYKGDGSFGSYGASYNSPPAVIGVAYNADAGTLIFYKNGVVQDQNYSGGVYTMAAPANYFASASNGTSVAWTVTANFGATPFTYPPSALSPPLVGYNAGLY